MDTIKIVGNPLYQWELGRKVKIFPLPNMTVDEVHFSNHGDPEALVVKPKEEDGMIIAEIPNILLQSGTALIVYSVNVAEGFTDNLRSCTFNVRKRAKPSDYVYTEVEILNYETLKHRMDEFEKNGVSEKQIANAVESYMNENPVEITGVVKTVNGTAPDESGNVEIEIPEADTSDCVKTVNGTAPDENGNVELPVPEGTVKSVNGVEPDENGNVEITIPDNVDLTGYATEQFVRDGFQPKGDYLESTELTNAINTALAQAKASGEFDGAPGKDGADGQPGKDGEPGKDGNPGAPGYTPVKGTDYYTEADKTEMVNAVLSALPTWTGGSY